MGQALSNVTDVGTLPTTVANNLSNNINSGISVVKDAEGNFFSLVKDTSSNIVSAYKHTTDNITLAYQGTEKDFFSVVNNISTNVTNLGLTLERNIRGAEKDVMTVIDYTMQEISNDYKLAVFQISNFLQWGLSLGAIFFLLIFIMYGDRIFNLITTIIDKGVHLTF